MRMALSASRAAFASRAAIKTLLGRHGAAVQIQVAGLKATYGEKYPYPEPFPYEKRRYTFFDELREDTRKRFNENSKVIVVEGNAGVGKNDFARRIAHNFDLKFIPGVTEDDIFVTQNKFDLRSTDSCLPEEAQCYTNAKLFHDSNPQRGTAVKLQYQYYCARFIQYFNKALLHLLSTGQGVVIVRSPWSDSVFADAQRQMGWLTKPGYQWYRDVVQHSICYVLKPHITLYLDAPVEVCMERAKAKGNEAEKGPNFTADYMRRIESNYKERYLPSIRNRQQVLEIDWTNIGDDLDMDVITDEIADLNLDNCDPQWTESSRNAFGQMRMDYTDPNGETAMHVSVPLPYHLDEIMETEDIRRLKTRVQQEHPAMQYRPGFAKELGDSVPRFNLF